jgi:hypothetical protein
MQLTFLYVLLHSGQVTLEPETIAQFNWRHEQQSAVMTSTPNKTRGRFGCYLFRQRYSVALSNVAVDVVDVSDVQVKVELPVRPVQAVRTPELGLLAALVLQVHAQVALVLVPLVALWAVIHFVL